MRTMARTLTLSLTTLVAMTTLAAAHTPAQKVDERQHRQAERIETGRKSGKITWTEGVKLRQEQARIARLEAIYKSDGKLDKWEQKRLAELQQEASRHIYKESHDRWSRWSVLPRVGR